MNRHSFYQRGQLDDQCTGDIERGMISDQWGLGGLDLAE